MTILYRPSRRFTCRRSVFACEPKYRMLRAINRVARIPVLHHAGLQALLSAHWQYMRAHSSWSRA